MIGARIQQSGRRRERPGLTIREVADRYDRSEATIRYRMNRRRFPPANIRLGARTVLWSLPYLEAWEDHIGASGPRLNGPEFAKHKCDLWQGDTKEIAKQVKKLIG